jgi:hypothetical protein
VIDHTGAHREADLGETTFAPIPADSGVELSIDATGAGPGFDIGATIVPLFKRAWSV